eukprot:403363382
MGCSQTKPLFREIKVGDLTLQNRAVVASTTRLRAGLAGVPNDLLVEYYTARARAGLILTECVAVSADGNAFPGAACLYNNEQVAGWKRVNESVHAAGGVIFAQIFHGGRVAHPDQIGGAMPISSSAIAINGTVHTQNGRVPHVTPQSASIHDIKRFVQDFKKSAELAKLAGFDGIELHAGNGYLIDQFLRNGVNQRTDNYGGSFENRARFLLEIVDEIAKVYSPKRIGVKISPNGVYNEMKDSDPIKLFQHVTQELSKRKIAFLELSEYFTFDATNKEHSDKFFQELPHKSTRAYLKPLFKGTFIVNTGYDEEKANHVISNGEADMVSFGSLYIANADLVERMAQGRALNSVGNVKEMGKLWTHYFYGTDGIGYTDLSVYEP